MSKQTLPESTKKTKEAPARNAPSARPARGRPYRRQTARVEERRDGKPLLFGWGKHLSRRQKDKIQKRTFWVFFMLAVLAVVGVLGYSVYYINIYVPGEPVVTVNGHQIPQSLFRKMNFYLAQDLTNQLADVSNKTNAAQKLASSSDPTQQAQGQQELAALQNQQQVLQANDNQPSVGSTSVEDLTDDVLIQEQIPILESQGVPASKLEASSQDITNKLNAFKKALPTTTSYNQFLSSAKMSEQDLRQLLAVIIRHDKMDQYQQSLVGGTVAQVHASDIQTTSLSDANKLMDQLKAATDVPTTFAKLAKSSSHDANTKSKGGDMGWVVYGDTGTGTAVESWLFNSSRKIGELSQPISIGGGQYEILYITAIDRHRPISAAEQSTLKGEAYTNWIAQIKLLPQTHITDVDSTKELDSNNFPASLPSSATNPSTNPGGSGLPVGP